MFGSIDCMTVGTVAVSIGVATIGTCTANNIGKGAGARRALSASVARCC